MPHRNRSPSRVSDPDTPAPHWQVVDSKGNVYLLPHFKIKGDKTNPSITVPAAEALLGEASFPAPVK